MTQTQGGLCGGRSPSSGRVGPRRPHGPAGSCPPAAWLSPKCPGEGALPAWRGEQTSASGRQTSGARLSDLVFSGSEVGTRFLGRHRSFRDRTCRASRRGAPHPPRLAPGLEVTAAGGSRPRRAPETGFSHLSKGVTSGPCSWQELLPETTLTACLQGRANLSD